VFENATIAPFGRSVGEGAVPGQGSGAMCGPRGIVLVQPLLRDLVKNRAVAVIVITAVATSVVVVVVVVVAPTSGVIVGGFRSGRGRGFGRGILRLLRGRGRRGSLRLLRGRGRRGGLRHGAALADAMVWGCALPLGDQSHRAFGYAAHIHAVRVRAFEIFHACSAIERIGSGLDSKGKGNGDDCSEGFELHFRAGTISERKVRGKAKLTNVSKK